MLFHFVEKKKISTGYVSLSPDRSSIEYHKARYLRDAIDAVPVEFITYGYLRHPNLTEKIKVPDFVRKTIGGTYIILRDSTADRLID
jgi:hypothetical protein